MREFTAMLMSRSPFGVQLAPESVDFQMPPATPAVHIRLFCVRWISSARERPPMLPGPRAVHAPLTEFVETLNLLVRSTAAPVVLWTGNALAACSASSRVERLMGAP